MIWKVSVVILGLFFSKQVTGCWVSLWMKNIEGDPDMPSIYGFNYDEKVCLPLLKLRLLFSPYWTFQG